MAGVVRLPRWQARSAGEVLVAFGLVSLAVGPTAWYQYRLPAGASVSRPYVDNPWAEADTYLRNLAPSVLGDQVLIAPAATHRGG